MSARSLTSGVVVAAFVALASSAGVVAANASRHRFLAAGHSPVVPTSDHGRGADVGFTEYSAAGSPTNGTVIGPSYNLYTLPAEAVGRTAVTLHGAGQYVEFTLAKRPTRLICVTRSPTQPTAAGSRRRCMSSWTAGRAPT